MLRVPSDELSFAWDHPRKTCVIKHGDRVVKRGNYRDMINLFHDLTDNEETVAIEYEDEQNGQQPERPEPEAPAAGGGGNAS